MRKVLELNGKTEILSIPNISMKPKKQHYFLKYPKSFISQFHIFSMIKSNEPSSNELYSSKCICVPQDTSVCAKFSK